MKVREHVTTTRVVDIGPVGPLDKVLRLPTGARIRHGIKTVCDRCGKPITDEHFIGVIKKSYRNLLFHEHCYDGPPPDAEEGSDA